MTKASRIELLPLLLLWVGVLIRAYNELWIWDQVYAAPIAGVQHLPSVAFWSLALVAGMTLAPVGVYAALRRRDARCVRLATIVAFLVLGADLLLIPSTRIAPMVTADQLTAASLEQLRVRFLVGLKSDPMPSSNERLRARVIEAVGDRFLPPYLQRGVPVEHWKLVLRSDCAGPVGAPGGAGPGTLFVCLSGDHSEAWISATGTGGPLAGPVGMVLDPAGSPLAVRIAALRASVPSGDSVLDPQQQN